MSRKLLALVLLALLATAPLNGGAWAQRPLVDPTVPLIGAPTDAAAREALLFHFATEYTNTMFVGLLAGTLVGYSVFNTAGGTLVGGMLGASAGSWWFYHRLASRFLISNPSPLHGTP